ncbi:hypothetical protein NQZ79_g1695 [Umbelopsis isabellina]|nr:hypothetical protein NQZ79_g1695 [Umbelopsis isabellina]
MAAAVHHGSNLRKAEEKRKVVYKAVLDTPFILKWPFTPANIHDEILQLLCDNLKPLGQARAERRRQRKNKVKVAENLPASPIVITGINAITRNLEKKDPDDSDALLFVCRGDIDPSQLCAHFPQLSALANRKLVSLQQGAETAISSSLGLKRVSAVQIQGTGDLWERLVKATSVIPTLDAPWLEARYMNTQIKTLETSTPVVTKQRPKPNQQQKPKHDQQQQPKHNQQQKQQFKQQPKQQQQQKQPSKPSNKRSNTDLQSSNNKKAKQ